MRGGFFLCGLIFVRRFCGFIWFWWGLDSIWVLVYFRINMKWYFVAGYSFAAVCSAVLFKIAFKLWGPSKYNHYDSQIEEAGVPGCLFCGFVRRMDEKVFEDEHVIAFHDISPYASTHLLVIPKRHIKNLLALKNEDLYLLEHMKSVGLALSERFGNEGSDLIFHKPAFNSILHLHLHVMVRPLTRPFWRRIFFNSYFSTPIDAVITSLKSKNN